MSEQPPRDDDALGASGSGDDAAGVDETTQMDPVDPDATTQMDPVDGPRGGHAAAGGATGTAPAAADERPWYREPRNWLYAGLGAAALLILLVAGGYGAIYASADIPSPDELAIPDPTVVLDREGEQFAKLDPASVRKNIAIDELPEHVPQAVMAAEDRNFREHDGWSATAIARAFWANLRSGETVQGASTITQQYVEIAVEDVDNSYLGKFREVAVAAKLDDELEKDEILEFYLNAVPFGRGAIGLEAAAQTYFGVSATELDVNQAATLAGMIAAPSAFDPGRNPDGARVRRDFVLNGMVEIGALSRSEADELIGQELPELSNDPLVAFGPNAYFLDAVREELPEVLNEQDAENLFNNLVVETTLDQRIQKLALDSVNAALEEVPYSGAVVTVDPTTGGVFALVGGRNYEEQQFNVAIEGSNQVGSSYKPFVLTEFVAQGFNPRESTVESPEVRELPNGDKIRNYSRQGYEPDPTVR
ncbi:MAG: transglycosylase domain-containing protein, partial [Nitriliruptorales bacterium]|nr:transglycosylase domain-containing protein [Nitriliruptorales bacterium]